jgi:hypothetical protein
MPVERTRKYHVGNGPAVTAVSCRLGRTSATILGMQAKKAVSVRIRREKKHNRALRAVRISGGLIAFYPDAIHRPQRYVILLDPASGMMRHLQIQPEK